MKSIAIRYSVGPSPEAPDKLNAVVLLGARWDGDSGVLAPIYFCPVGTILAFSFKIVSVVVCCARLCTESNLLLMSSLFNEIKEIS